MLKKASMSNFRAERAYERAEAAYQLLLRWQLRWLWHWPSLSSHTCHLSSAMITSVQDHQPSASSLYNCTAYA